MCLGSFAKCLGICLIPLSIVSVLCNILLFFPDGKSVDVDYITEEVWYFGGIFGSGLLMIFPITAFLGLKNNDCCGCCGNESCGRRFAMLSSILFAAVGVMGAGYSVIVSSIAINHGPLCVTNTTGADQWTYPFSDGDYLSDQSSWTQCIKPTKIVHWHVSLFLVLMIMAIIQAALCAVQVVNGLMGALCGDCCVCYEKQNRTV